jgi:hypothetical protein
MKVLFAALVTLLNIAIAAYSAYQSVKLAGMIGVAQWIGTTLPIFPFLLVGIYGCNPGSRTLWNWAFSLNCLVLLICIAANVLELVAGSSALFSVWAVTVVYALLTAINLAVLLWFPPKPNPELAVAEQE